MSIFQQGQRVFVKPLFASKEHGTVKSIDKGLMITKVEVSLDNGDIKKYPPGDLSFEELTPDEVAAEIKKVKNQVDKVSSQLPGEIKTELPNHLRYLAEAQKSNYKEKVARECKYVAQELEDAHRNEFVTKEWWQNTEISLKKIDWAMKGSPK